MPRITASLPVLLFGVGCASAASSALPTPACPFEMQSSVGLRDAAGAPVFVGPEALAFGRSERLVAGSHSIRFPTGAQPVQDEFIAAIVAEGQAPRFVRTPSLPGHQIEQVRAVSMPNGGWGLIAHAEPRDRASDVPAVVLFIEVSATGQAVAQEIPVPNGVRARRPIGSLRIPRPGELLLALPADSSTAAGVVLLRRQRGRWSSRYVGTRMLAYTDAAHVGDEVMAAFVRPDFRQKRSGNAVFFGPATGPLDAQQLLFDDLARPAQAVALASSRDRALVVWVVADSSPAETMSARAALYAHGRLTPVAGVVENVLRALPLYGEPEGPAILAQQKTSDGSRFLRIPIVDGAFGRPDVLAIGRPVLEFATANSNSATSTDVAMVEELDGGEAVQTVLKRFARSCRR